MWRDVKWSRWIRTVSVQLLTEALLLNVTADRTKAVTDPYMIDGWLGFDFPGRGEQYSAQKYHWYHFTGTDYNNANRRTAIYRILGDGKNWSNFVDKEKGNYDYLM